MEETQKKIPYFHYAVVIASCFFFRFLPNFAGLSDFGMAVIGCFIGAVYGWIMIDMLWPSIIAILGMCVSDLGITQTLAGSFGSYVFIGLLLIYTMIALSSKTNALKWVADRITSSSLLEGKPWLIVWVILLLSWIFGLVNNVAGMVIFGAIITSMCTDCCMNQKNSKLAIFLYLGCSLALMFGQIMFPFMSTGLVMYAAYVSMFPSMPMPMAAYVLFMAIMGFLMVTFWVVLMRFVFRVDVSPLAKCSCSTQENITRNQRIALFLIAFFILLNVLALLPLGWFSALLNKFGIFGFAAITVCLIPLIKGDDGKPVANLPELLSAGDWGQLFFIAFIMLLSATMNDASTGIPAAIPLIFKPFEFLPPWVFIIVAIVIAVVLTNFANNLLLSVVVMPFMVSYAQSAGIDPRMIVALLFFMVQFALLTPAASPTTGIAMGMPLVDVAPMMRTAIKVLPILIMFGLVVGVPLAQVIFGVLG